MMRRQRTGVMTGIHLAAPAYILKNVVGRIDAGSILINSIRRQEGRKFGYYVDIVCVESLPQV